MIMFSNTNYSKYRIGFILRLIKNRKFNSIQIDRNTYNIIKMLANILILLAPIAYSINDSFNYTKGGADWEGNCKSGPIQSPINIRYSRAILPAPGLGEISTNFLNTTLSGNFSDRGLGIKGNFGNISFYEYGYYLESAIKKVYFFAPAQHYLNNRKYSLEVTILMDETFDGY